MFDRKKYSHEHYLANIELYRERSRLSSKRQRDKKRQVIVDAKSRPCADCGIQYPSYVMQFDHVRGDKVANVSNMYTDTYGMARILAEIDKCEVVCANCHAIRTHTRKQGSFV
jgi:thiol:disulfide interchange protein